MSHIMFGDFYAANLNTDVVNEVKAKILHSNILLLINHEIDFFNDINIMLNENSSQYGNNYFCFTTLKQKYNSEDLLFPYDKYTNEELFPNKEDRSKFEKICNMNLTLLVEAIIEFKSRIEMQYLRIFITEGYDNEFNIKRCTLSEMFQDILTQVINSFNLESTIYEIID